MARAFLAPSLVRLRAAVNADWPNRSKASDGWIGNAAHAARVSQHNPDANGCVHAIDVTIAGIDVAALLKAVIGHEGVWYVIHNGHIWSRTYGWRKRVYTGPNPHHLHVHISILLTRAAENGTWDWLAKAVDAAADPVDLRRGDHGSAVVALQKALGIPADGSFGPNTENAVNRWKSRHHLPTDGIAGAAVRAGLKL